MNLAVGRFCQNENWILPCYRLHLLFMKLILSTHNVTLTKAIEDLRPRQAR